MSKVDHSAFDADGNWVMPSMRNKGKTSREMENKSKSLDEWEAGPKVRENEEKATSTAWATFTMSLKAARPEIQYP